MRDVCVKGINHVNDMGEHDFLAIQFYFPSWVLAEDAEVPQSFLLQAASLIRNLE